MKEGFIESLMTPLRMVFIMWAVFFIDPFLTFVDFRIFGIFPRSLAGLIGIFTAPLIHGNLAHLISNTLPLLFLGTTLYFFYHRLANAVFFGIYLVCNLLVWLLARPSIHIGASGIIYGLAGFLIFFGIFRKDFKSLFISIIITLFYGGLVYGIFPNQPGISWESHLLGGITGAFFAMQFSKRKRI
ncbi:MAG: rhomboid family intramembrane serine protease [Cyclobacteriaceae bacterium]